MADPKKAGEQADQMIAEQNRLRAEAQAPAAEDQSATGEAIAEVGDANDQPDVSAAVAEPSAQNPELETLREQVRVSDQRWNVLQGMVNKKDSEIEQLRTLLAQLNQKRDETPTAPAAKSPAVSEQDVEDFGQDLIDLISKVASGIAASEVGRLSASIERQIGEIKGTVTGVSETTARTAASTFNDNLTKRVSTWEAINLDPAFMAWLDQIDDFAGEKRIDLLNDAYSRMDLNRTAKFFEKFIEETKPSAPAPADVSATVASAEKLVSPSRSRQAAAPVQAQNDKMWSSADIRRLYADQRAGKISAEEFTKLERDLFKAQSENRIAA